MKWFNFLNLPKETFPDNKGIVYCPCKICENTKKKTAEKKKYSIIYVVMKLFKIIRHECGMMK